MKKVTVIGCGAWASTVANILATKGYPTHIICHRQGIVDEINNSHTRSLLDDLPLSPAIHATLSFEEGLSNSHAIIFCVASPYLKESCDKWLKAFDPTIPVLTLTKGILSKHELFLSDYLEKTLVGIKLSTLSGPNLAKEVALKQPTASVVASKHADCSALFQDLLSSDYFRVYRSNDYKGVLLGGILKNCIALAAGAIDALEMGINTRSTLITRGLQEMIRFGKHFGAEESTFYGLSGLGDLIATCSSPQSRNYSAGFALGLGDTFNNGSSVVEGINTVFIVHEICRKEGIDMPIIHTLYKVLNKECTVRDGIYSLMSRSLKSE